MTNAIMSFIFFIADNAPAVAMFSIMLAWLVATILIKKQSQIG